MALAGPILSVEVFNKAEFRRFVLNAPLMVQKAVERESKVIGNAALRALKKEAPRGHHLQAGRGKSHRIGPAPGPHLKDSFGYKIDLSGLNRKIEFYSSQPYAKWVLKGRKAVYPQTGEFLKWVKAGPRGGGAHIVWSKRTGPVKANRFDDRAIVRMQPDMGRALDRIGTRIAKDWSVRF